jgi:hypothetical protein
MEVILKFFEALGRVVGPPFIDVNANKVIRITRIWSGR